jgi:hypothetical protein
VAPEAFPVPTEPPITIPAPTADDALQAALDDDDLAAIYLAVVRRLYLVDHTFEEGHQFPAVYLLTTTDDSVGDPEAPKGEGQRISGFVQQVVIEALSSDPAIAASVAWVDSRDEVPMDEHGTVEDGGAIFTLGNAHRQDDGSVLVSAGLYFGMLGAGGRTYVLQEGDGGWQVVGDTGVEWIS